MPAKLVASPAYAIQVVAYRGTARAQEEVQRLKKGGEEASVKGSMKPALGATIGRVIGTASKVGIGIAVWLALTVSAALP